MKKFAMHSGTDVRIVEVRETAVFYIFQDERFKKEENPTPDLIASGYGRKGVFKNYVLSEIDAPVIKEKILVIKEKILWKKQRTLTRDFINAISKKYDSNLWNPQKTVNLTIEQAKHLNDYLSLGLEIEK